MNQPLETGLRYLLTGGLNFRQLAPDALFGLVKYFERFDFVSKILGIHWLIVIEKVEN